MHAAVHAAVHAVVHTAVHASVHTFMHDVVFAALLLCCSASLALGLFLHFCGPWPFWPLPTPALAALFPLVAWPLFYFALVALALQVR